MFFSFQEKFVFSCYFLSTHFPFPIREDSDKSLEDLGGDESQESTRRMDIQKLLESLDSPKTTDILGSLNRMESMESLGSLERMELGLQGYRKGGI